MADADRALTTRDIVLLINHAAGDTVDGRTVMQKFAYFAALGVQTDLGHRPHFYGPFSSKVEDAVENAVLANELHETVERMPHWSGGPDLLKYTYVLTNSGKERVDSLIEHNPEEWDRVRDAIHAVKRVLPSLDPKTLSSAAKTHLILSQQDVTVTEIPAVARRLGWDLDTHQVENTVRLLEQLNLVSSPQEEGGTK